MRNARSEAENVLTQEQDLHEQEHVQLQCAVCTAKATYNVVRGFGAVHTCYSHALDLKRIYKATISPIEHVGSNQPRIWRF